MRYAFLFALLAAGFACLAAQHGGPWWLLAWPAVSCGVMAIAYGGWGPTPLGKRSDGTVAWASALLLLPYVLYARAVWWTRTTLTREPQATEVAPGVWVGRRPTRGLPPGTVTMVDLTAEFPGVAAVRRLPGYVAVPTLDGTPPDVAVAAAAVRRVESAGGSAYIGCAFGHGRSAAVAAALLVYRGLAADVAAAEALMRSRRPGVRLTRGQRAAAADVVRLLGADGA